MADEKQPDPHDPLPALLAELDQAMKMIPQQARAMRVMFVALVEEGFTYKEALYLTACQFSPPRPPDEEG
jgi:hypothetical protein